MNWGWILLRVALGLSAVTVLFLSQRFWYRSLWRVTGHWGRTWLRVGVRLLYLTGLVLIIVTIADNIRQDRGSVLGQWRRTVRRSARRSPWVLRSAAR